MNDKTSDLPQAENADPDGVQVALRAAQTLWSRGDTTESLKWLRKAAESASDEGADVRSYQLAKAAAELRAKLFGSNEGAGSVRSSSMSGEGSAAPSAAPLEHGQAAYASAAPAGLVELGRSPAPEENPAPGSVRPVVTATQYPSHRPRQRMGLSPSSRESSAQREGSYSSWSADSERRASSSAPPPLPRASVDEYEELEAEPDEDSGDDARPGWSNAPQDSWRPSEPPASESSRRVPTLPPAAFQATPASLPPPLPSASAFADDSDFMRDEQPTVAIPPPEEGAAGAAFRASGGGRESSRNAADGFAAQGHSWDSQSRVSGWEQEGGFLWSGEARGGSWGAAATFESGSTDGSSSFSEGAPQKLTARVHHQAVRVSFAPDVRAPGQYVVRPLREGEKAPPGERTALLVALEPGVPLV